MTNKEVAQAIIDAFDCEYYQKVRTRQDALANVLREVANQLQYHNFGEGVDMIVDAHSLYEVADELEVL